VERTQFALASVARGVDRLVTRVDHFGGGAVQVVDHSTDGPLVARDRMRTQYDGVVGTDLQEPRVASRQLRQRASGSPWLPVQITQTSRGVAIDVLDVDQVGGVDVQELSLRASLTFASSSDPSTRSCGAARVRR